MAARAFAKAPVRVHRPSALASTATRQAVAPDKAVAPSYSAGGDAGHGAVDQAVAGQQCGASCPGKSASLEQDIGQLEEDVAAVDTQLCFSQAHTSAHFSEEQHGVLNPHAEHDILQCYYEERGDDNDEEGRHCCSAPCSPRGAGALSPCGQDMLSPRDPLATKLLASPDGAFRIVSRAMLETRSAAATPLSDRAPCSRLRRFQEDMLSPGSSFKVLRVLVV